jgi:hypothetical protein
MLNLIAFRFIVRLELMALNIVSGAESYKAYEQNYRCGLRGEDLRDATKNLPIELLSQEIDRYCYKHRIISLHLI